MICNDIILIGASGGIGQFIVDYYKEQVSTIFGTYNNNKDTLIKGINIHYYELDVGSKHETIKFINYIKGFLQRPVLIYTPAVALNNLVHKYTEEDWNQTLAINLTGAFSLTSKFIPIMRELKFGRIIYLSSILSQIGVEGTVAYSATKAALNSMVKVIAKENAKFNITANTLVLGYYDIGIIKSVPKKYLNENVIPNIPCGHLGDPINIINAIEFLIKSDFVNGANINMDGGM